MADRILAAEDTKSGKPRYVPLSSNALEWLTSLDRIVGIPYVYVYRGRNDRYRDVRAPFFQGRNEAGLDWVGIHDLRHFRATQWVKHGVDIRTVQELLGHADIQTTL